MFRQIADLSALTICDGVTAGVRTHRWSDWSIKLDSLVLQTGSGPIRTPRVPHINVLGTVGMFVCVCSHGADAQFAKDRRAFYAEQNALCNEIAFS